MSEDEPRATDLPASTSGPTSLEWFDRTIFVTWLVLLAVTAAAWVHVILTAGPMSDHMTMEGMSLGVRDGMAFVVAWGVMMAAMMLPSALPMIALYGAMQRKAGTGAASGAPLALFSLVSCKSPPGRCPAFPSMSRITSSSSWERIDCRPSSPAFSWSPASTSCLH